MQEEYQERLLQRFLNYVKIDTQSNAAQSGHPTSQGQWELARFLKTELEGLGVKKIHLSDHCFLSASLEANTGNIPVIGFLAHLDTSADAPGQGVKPLVHPDYDGKPIVLGGRKALDPAQNPELGQYNGTTLITSDGHTLLGADDKAGVAAIMTAVEYLRNHPEIPHGKLEIIFTPDEETGTGLDAFPDKEVTARFCYTIDGDGEGVIEAECFNAYKTELSITGRAAHLGYARGNLINAIELAAKFVNLLPEDQRPQTSDGALGYYAPAEISGNFSRVNLNFLIRDFDDAVCQKRLRDLENIAATLQSLYPGSDFKLKSQKQYPNMQQYLKDYPDVVEKLIRAVRQTGMEPVLKRIRGGTDGARLSAKGIPTPNVFAGGYNFHSLTEWASLRAMARAADTIINLARLWAEP